MELDYDKDNSDEDYQFEDALSDYEKEANSASFANAKLA